MTNKIEFQPKTKYRNRQDGSIWRFVNRSGAGWSGRFVRLDENGKAVQRKGFPLNRFNIGDPVEVATTGFSGVIVFAANEAIAA